MKKTGYNKNMNATPRGKNWNRDDTGRPTQRSSTWGKTSRDPKSDRRDSKKEIDIRWHG